MRCAARHSHIFYSPDKDGKMTIYRTAGNPYGHVILRGGHRPNYDTASIDEACRRLWPRWACRSAWWWTSATATA
jgi:3-deoxy-7-phosphoheptulonate synthase